MVDPRCVDYIRTNKDKYPMDMLKAALLKAGAAPADIEEAARLAAAPPPESIPMTAPPMRRTAASFAEIFPAAAAPAPAAAAPAPAPAAAPVPAPDAAALAQGILPRMRSVLLDPAGFFRAMPKSGGWMEPAAFLVAMSVLSAVIRLLLGVALRLFGPGGSGASVVLFAGIFSLILAVIVVPIAAVVVAGIAHVIWTFLGSQQPFETSLRCIAFMTALMPVQAVVQAIPVIGLWLAMPVALYGIYLFLPASTEVHAVEKRKATMVVLIFGGIALLGLLSSAYTMWKLRRLVGSGGGVAQAHALRSLIDAGRIATEAQRTSAGPGASPAALQQQVMSQLAQLQAQGGAAAAAAPGQSQNPAEAMQAMSAALGALGADSNVKAVAATGLQALLPAQVPGLTRAGANSGKQKLGAMEMAAAEGTYRAADGGAVMIQIIDAGSYSGLLSMAWNAAGSVPGQSPVTYKSCPGIEQYDRGSRSGSLQIIAAQRFAVKVSGQNVDHKVLRTAMDSVDIDALGRLAR